MDAKRRKEGAKNGGGEGMRWRTDERHPGLTEEPFSLCQGGCGGQFGGGLEPAKMASYHDGESRIIRGLTQAGLVERAGLGLVSGESARPDAYAGAGRPVPAYTEEARLDAILGEESRLISRAKAEGFFWDADTVAEVDVCGVIPCSAGTGQRCWRYGRSTWASRFWICSESPGKCSGPASMTEPAEL